MTSATGHLSTTNWVLLILAAAVVLAIVAGLTGRALVRRGLREPFVVRLVNRTSERIVDGIRRPITIAVLDEVAAVLQTGHYTRNIASALRENHEEIKQMFAEKIKEDPTARHIGLLPFHDRIIDEASETTLRVLLEVLADPRTDELISDLLRDNINQIRLAVRARQDAT
jgi:ferritin-like protein